MHEFSPGQRWISDAELHMGLGTILSVEHRTVTVLFLATGETRTYARQSAPLTRVIFACGDSIKDHDGRTLKVVSVAESGGIITYSGILEDGTHSTLDEGQLDNFIQLNRPTERLFTGQIDQDKWFELRYQTLLHASNLAHSDMRGLAGVRTSLIPHQLYIAHEVANRYAPRVLLADEVGLGKTIEAGLILHHQLLTERARRVLVVVPESLQHQWLVEMLRRFNLYFSLLDEERCLAIEESTNEQNPFHAEQLVLCSLEFITRDAGRYKQALAGNWDLLVVDEAHHLQWSPQQPSLEYELVELLAAGTSGVLLLTATPEQLGKESHFARLRLLDPDRFPDFDAFIEEEKHYEPVTQAVNTLLSEQPLDEATTGTLLATLQEGDNRTLLETLQDNTASKQQQAAARRELVEHLLDRHGTGRVLFRNTRAAVKGFPQRKLSRYPLPLPDEYRSCLALFRASGVSEPQQLLSPELLYQSHGGQIQNHWTAIDPRVKWLGTQLKQLRPHKVLIITASAETALDLAEVLRVRAGIHAAVFHEGMNIIERDRAAAFFADQEYGSQALICSEIGSEGRNFQFAHHLILFDLPFNPDLLEQRIGRLDRIGQQQEIHIHVPYMENSPQEIMTSWYHEGLSSFEHTCPAGHSIFTQVEATLLDALHQFDNDLVDEGFINESLADLSALISTTQKLYREMSEALQRGRDQLLEYNSCRPHIAHALQQRAQAYDSNSTLPDYMEAIFDCFGVDSEPHSETSDVIRPGEHMQASLPRLSEDGITITYDRDTALSNEDIHFITWEHPMVTGAMEMVLGSELGNTAVTAVSYNRVTPGTILVECLYILESASSNALQASRYLPPTPVRVVVDEHGHNHTDTLSHDAISRERVMVDRETAHKIVRAKEGGLRKLVTISEEIAHAHAPEILTSAHDQTRETLQKEIHRLQALQQVNPNVRREEIDFFESQWHALTQILESATLRLDALRVIVAT